MTFHNADANQFSLEKRPLKETFKRDLLLMLEPF